MANGVEIKRLLETNIGGNTGNLKTKIRGEHGTDIFEGICKGPVADSLDMDENDKFIRINGDNYIIGEGVTNSGEIYDRDLNEIKALLLCGIMRQLRHRDDIKEYGKINVNLCVGLPIKEYTKNKKASVTYLENQLAGEKFKVEFMGINTEIEFKRVKVMPEGYAWYFVNKNKLSEHDTAVIIDIGSRTIDLCYIKDGKPYYPESLPYGTTLVLYKDIRFAMEKKFNEPGENITDEHISKLIEKGSVRVGRNTYIKSDYDNIIENYWKKIDRLVKQTDGYKDYSSAHEIVILGGGKYLVYDYAKKDLNNTNVPDIKDAEFGNAEAYYVWSHKK